MREDMDNYDKDSSQYTQSLVLLAWLYWPAENDFD
ncbi:hypothetical protein swp_2627 [Shewanella piezotolerans WP3]|uniref:Uncharacterized protein n=1 Tax=Shewanella piezotolerans (strain WP3 / JCM 13877) TaxID=225849 RepID=B8CPB9_SHEPW|nr:hypothetical protein swp_2627 [Shewanella piezotolerans WP3]